MDFAQSETAKNLMRAFAGESQARNRYTFAASVAKKQDLPLLERVFLFTAGQEKEHAEIFYNHLKALAGQTIFIDGGYPVDIDADIGNLLQKAKHNEFEEYEDVYPKFAAVAKEEGFADVAQSFSMIAEIEKTHGERFLRYANAVKDGTLFAAAAEKEWLCLNCGHIHKGPKAPKQCPVCAHAQGYFIERELKL